MKKRGVKEGSRSLTAEVARHVVARGMATLNDLMPLYPQLTRSQLAKALTNAKAAGLLRLVQRGSGGRGGPTNPGIWGAPQDDPDAPLPSVRIRPPNSPWELGALLHMPGGWPPPCAQARRYQPLGGWFDV